MAAPIDAVIARIRAVYGGWIRATSFATMRDDWDVFFEPSETSPADCVTVSGVPARWINMPLGRDDPCILYLHGGGFRIGSTRSHRELMARIAVDARCNVLGLDYRRAPEHLFPAALDDTVAAYMELVAQGFDPSRVALVGDSAGANLVLGTLLAMRDRGERMPAAAVLMSPWVDLTAVGESYRTRAEADPIHQRSMILALAHGYLNGSVAPDDPQASPLFADLRGLPPLLIQVGGRETLLSDSMRLAERAKAAGVVAELRVYENMIHVFQQFPNELSEAREAIAEAGAFLRRYLGAQSIMGAR
jgi:acetyl esterase/lipase